jgi:hypothetical protein
MNFIYVYTLYICMYVYIIIYIYIMICVYTVYIYKVSAAPQLNSWLRSY